MRFIVAITGCSGIRYGVRLLQELEGEGAYHLRHEQGPGGTDLEVEPWKRWWTKYDNDDLFAPPESFHFSKSMP